MIASISSFLNLFSIKGLSFAVLLSPLIAALITGFFNKSLHEKISHTLCVLGVSISFLCSVGLLFLLSMENSRATEIVLYSWGTAGSISVNIGILLDRLTLVMTTIVTFVSMLVHIYSVGYLRDDSGYQRFFSYISLFTFGMLALVMSNNFLQLFFGWEMVGLMSYLLIGFWFKKETAIVANLKAFLVNRVGDFAFILGIAAIAYYFNALDYHTVFQGSEVMAYSQAALPIFGVPISAITLICILFFIGAMGKSAQIPLHVWLPDSMEGPTPISALIHAATMVTAGVFMLARLSPLFEYSETALNFIVIIGSLTACLMGLVAIVQNDIKRIIAYSTVSQLGYMMVAMGVSAYSVGIFHLITHAFFKALLFLGAGSVILALHHEQNIWRMGNLAKYMRITSITMFIGCFALIGFPFFSGYYSKDLILHAVEHSSIASAPFAYWIVTAGILITALYTFRLFFVVFYSKERFPDSLKPHVHEQSGSIYWPLIILAIPSVIAGFVFMNALQDNYFASTIFVLPEHDVLKEFWQTYEDPIQYGLQGFTELPVYLGILGIIISVMTYQFYPNAASIIKAKMGLLYRVLSAKLGFDYFYEKLFVPCMLKLANIFWIFGDRTLIDGLGVNASVKTVSKFGDLVRHFQSGYLYHYAFVMITGFLVMLLWLLWI